MPFANVLHSVSYAGVWTGQAALARFYPQGENAWLRRRHADGLRARARKSPGRADAMGRRGVRDRGLCRRRRGRDDALARGMVDRRRAGRWPNIARGDDREDRRGRAKTVAAGERPLAGLRVLDLSRVIAGPVAGRTLAAHGADVMLISGPDLPAIPWLTIDTGRGKLRLLPISRAKRDARRCAGCWRRPISFRRAIGRARSRPRLFAGRGGADQSRHRLCVAVGLWPRRAVGGAARI